MKSLLLLGFLVWCTEGLICTIGQERDPQSGGQYRWVIPVPDPCQCTTLLVGGLNTRTPYRPFVVTYMDTFIYSDDLEEIWTWLNCTDLHLILKRSLRRDGNPGQCDAATVNSTEYDIGGNTNLVKMVPGPDVADQACAVYTQAGSYLDLGDFNGTCISDPSLCESMTWSLWLNINTSSGFTGERYYISSGGQTGLARGSALLYKSETDKEGQFEIHVRTEKSQYYNRYDKTTFPLDKWFHLAFTIEMNQKVVKGLKLYVDGEFKHEDESTPKYSGTDNGGGTNNDACTKLYLGFANTCETQILSNDFSGSAAYSNLMVFDRLLNQDQIKHLKELKN